MFYFEKIHQILDATPISDFLPSHANVHGFAEVENQSRLRIFSGSERLVASGTLITSSVDPLV